MSYIGQSQDNQQIRPPLEMHWRGGIPIALKILSAFLEVPPPLSAILQSCDMLLFFCITFHDFERFVLNKKASAGMVGLVF